MVSSMVTALATVASSIITGLVAIYICNVQHDKNMALVSYRLEQLEEKVDKHNNLVERMYKVEADIKAMQ